MINSEFFYPIVQGQLPFWLIPTFGLAIVVLALWSIAWKGLALWHAARLGHKGWFVVLLIINTAGILEIVYIFAVAKENPFSSWVKKIGLSSQRQGGSGDAGSPENYPHSQ